MRGSARHQPASQSSNQLFSTISNGQPSANGAPSPRPAYCQQHMVLLRKGPAKPPERLSHSCHLNNIVLAIKHMITQHSLILEGASMGNISSLAQSIKGLT